MTQKNVVALVQVQRLADIQVELEALNARLTLLNSMREYYLETFRHQHRCTMSSGDLFKHLTLDEFKVIGNTSDKITDVKKVIKLLSAESHNIAKKIFKK